MKKFLTTIIIIALLTLLGWKVYLKVNASQEAPGRPSRSIPPVAVQIKPVLKTTIKDISHFTGTLYPRSQFKVAPKVGGRLEKLYVNIGDRIRRGQLIAQLDDDEYLQQVTQAEAELEVARARIEESKSKIDIALRELERIRELRKKNISSQSDLDNAEAQYKAQSANHKVVQSQFAQKEAALKTARIRLGYTKIHVSWDDGGDYRVVGERYVDEGAMLAPNAPIVSIIDNASLIAVINVIERDYPRIDKGHRALITTDAFPEKEFSGKIIRVAPLLQETSRQARVEIEIPNPQDLLKPGMFVRVQLELTRHDNAVVVPITAIVKRDGKDSLFIADKEEAKARLVRIELGIVNGEFAEVVDPALSGFVVTLGQHLLRDGSPIILPVNGQEAPQGAEGPATGARPVPGSGGRP